MTTSELISYIRKQIQNNISKDLIISKLMGAGWHIEDIDEGFLSVESEFKTSIPEVKKELNNIDALNSNQEVTFSDRYHEPLEGTNIFAVKMEPHKVEVPNIIEPKIEAIKVETPVSEILQDSTLADVVLSDFIKPEIPEIVTSNEVTPIIEIPKIENHELDTYKIELPVAEASKVEAPKKIWVPMSVPIKEKAHLETTEIITQNLELKTNQNIKNVGPKENFIKISPLVNSQYQNKKEELIPILVPKKPMVNSFDSINKDNIKKPDMAVSVEGTSKDSAVKSLPKIAMLSSYRSDLLSVNKTIVDTVKTKKSKLKKWTILTLIVLVLTGVVWLFVSGYIKIENLNIPFVKKDPKALLLSNSTILASLKSYKTETNIEVSSPSFSNITYGLVSGEAVTSSDVDSFSLNTLGVINQNGKGLLSDNFITIKSSLLQNYITTDVKNNGTDLFISVPDLGQIIKENAPEATIVKINEQQFDLIPSLFSPNIEAQLKKINIYQILSNGMPSYIDKGTLTEYNELINKVEITEKGQENIKGIDTYHYSINADRQLAKKLLNKVASNFILNLSSDDTDRLDQIIGGVTIDSFDVWVGKGDNNIYQYSVVIDIPLSKIIGFEDKSIGNNKINISWKTTYYDFNISNNILIPERSTPITDFVNTIKEVNMKNEISAFKKIATSLSMVEGGYGKISNPSGSCMNPTSGSLFSPIGHVKGATTAVSSISGLLNKVLGKTNGVGACYSTLKDWSFSVPITDNYDPASVSTTGYKYYFCIDSSGSARNLITPQLGIVCK